MKLPQQLLWAFGFRRLRPDNHACGRQCIGIQSSPVLAQLPGFLLGKQSPAFLGQAAVRAADPVFQQKRLQGLFLLAAQLCGITDLFGPHGDDEIIVGQGDLRGHRGLLGFLGIAYHLD